MVATQNMRSVDAAGPVVIVGAGQAGFSVAQKLREFGHTGPVTLVGEEPHPPYQRPPLSKSYLLGEMSAERLYLRPRGFYDEKAIELRLDCRVVRIDRPARRIELSDGSYLAYGSLVLATGARPRSLPASLGGQLAGVYPIRTLADIDAVAVEFHAGRQALVVGGGYIGLEIAAVAAKRGLKVKLVEAAPRILQRVASPQTSGYFRDLHRSHGVEIFEETGLAALIGDGRVEIARLGDGSEFAVDFVVAGIGIQPNVELAEAAGLKIEDGISVDAHCQTSDPGILAAGDCASFPWRGRRIRLESVGNAIDQAEAVAKTLMGKSEGYRANPWFWSDQFDTKLQIAGLSSGYDQVVCRKVSDSSLSFWYFRGQELLAVDAINDPRAYMVAKRLLEADRSPPPSSVSDPATDLKTLLAR